MQVVDPNAMNKKRTRKVKSKSNAETPEQYQNPYSMMSQGLESQQRYYVRAKDKGGVFTKRILESIKARPRDGLRAVAFSAGSGTRATGYYYSPADTFGVAWMDETTILGINDTSMAEDLKRIQDMAEKQAEKNTIHNATTRVKMLLAMLDDAEVLGDEDAQVALRNNRHYGKVVGALRVKGLLITIFEEGLQ